MKVDVSGMVWIRKADLGPSGIAYLKKDLTVIPKKFSAFSDVKPSPIRCYREERGMFGVPRAYFFKTLRKSHDIKWSYSEGKEMSGFKSLLKQEGKYAEQATAIESMLAHMNGKSGDISKGIGLGAILQGATGFGKTNCFLSLAHRNNRTTLICVHKEFLMRQWVRRINQFMPDAKVGVIQGKKCEFEGMDFVIGMVQSLALEGADEKQRYPSEMYSYFGLIGVDECFIGSQRIEMGHGGPRRIDEVSVGDVVPNAMGYGRVTDAMSRWAKISDMRIVTVNGKKHACTKDHTYFTSNGWVKSGSLKPSDLVLTHDGCANVVSSLRRVREEGVGQTWNEALPSETLLSTLSEELDEEGQIEEREKKEPTPLLIRVDSVEIPRREDLMGLGARVDGNMVRVHNVSVSGHPSYVLNGGAVVHNCHRIGAESWSRVPSLFSAKHIVGLTATPRRKDGADKVFWWFIGDIVYKASSETPKPSIKIIEANAKGHEALVMDTMSPSVSVSMLTKIKKRNRLIADETIKALVRSNRKIMVISERLEQLRDLEEMVRDGYRGDDLTTGFYVGEWFTGESTLSLKRVRDLGDDRERAIAKIYRHFRRKSAVGTDIESTNKDDADTTRNSKAKPGKTLLWGGKCGRIRSDGAREIKLYILQKKKRESPPMTHRVLEELTDSQLCLLARHHDIAQARSVPIKKQLTEDDLHKAEGARVVFATYQACAEGTDIPAIDVQVLASPISDAEQAIGRVRRYCSPKEHGGDRSPGDCEHLCKWRHSNCKGKGDPIVVDIVDRMFPMAERRIKKRLEFYRSLGLKVVKSGYLTDASHAVR